MNRINDRMKFSPCHTSLGFLLLVLIHNGVSSDAFLLNSAKQRSNRNSWFLSTEMPRTVAQSRPRLLLFSSLENEQASWVDDTTEIKSAALEWMSEQRRQLEQDEADTVATLSTITTDLTVVKPKKYCVIGGGWGGWGAAKTLCQSAGADAHVILIDALPDPTGETPYLSKSGKPVEAGTRGFWKDYPNINALCKELGLNEDDVFTPFTNSSFYSPDGLEATAPVFSEARVPKIPLPIFDQLLSDQMIPTLPSPLGQILATFPLFERLPLIDRASVVGLLVATVDCLGSNDESVYEQYDRMTAHELFLRFGLSSRVIRDFIKPTLLVGLFKPPEELSALVVMELLYYYALAHMDSFDVRWIKNGTVGSSLIAPLASRLTQEYNLTILGGCRVGEVSLCQRSSDGKLSAHRMTYVDRNGETREIYDVDGVILALGSKGMESVVKSSPGLARLPVFSKAASLKGIDVISTRIWFDQVIPTRTPANVFSRFESLRGAGGTFFMLDQLQGNGPELWGETAKTPNSTAYGSVVACDFYNAGALISLSDQDIINLIAKELLPSAVPRFADAAVLDSWVGKYFGSTTWFSPGSYTSRPPLEGAGNDVLPNVKCAGDWVRMGEKEHGAKGLCQERAYVSGIEAGNSLLKSVQPDKQPSNNNVVLPTREDEIQFKLSAQLSKSVMQFLPRFWVR